MEKFADVVLRLFSSSSVTRATFHSLVQVVSGRHRISSIACLQHLRMLQHVRTHRACLIDKCLAKTAAASMGCGQRLLLRFSGRVRADKDKHSLIVAWLLNVQVMWRAISILPGTCLRNKTCEGEWTSERNQEVMECTHMESTEHRNISRRILLPDKVMYTAKV